jgi:hypothetical protein
MTGAVAERSGMAAGATVPTVQLKTISARPNAAGTSLVVETSEPTAYATSRPDPLTILLDLRNVDGEKVTKSVGRTADSPIVDIAVEATESLGSPVSRVRVKLAEAANYQVRSERNTIVLDLARPAAPKVAQSATTAAVDPIAALGLNEPAVQPRPVVRVQSAPMPAQAQATPAVQAKTRVRDAAAPSSGSTRCSSSSA